MESGCYNLDAGGARNGVPGQHEGKPEVPLLYLKHQPKVPGVTGGLTFVNPKKLEFWFFYEIMRVQQIPCHDMRINVIS